MAFNRWSPYSYGTNNTKGWRLSPYDPDDGRIFLGMRAPTNRREWIDAIEYSSKAWHDDKENLNDWLEYIPEEIFLYQAVVYVAGYYVTVKNQNPNVVFAYRSLIETLLSEMSPESIFKLDLKEWSVLRNTPIQISNAKSLSRDNLSKSNNEFQCSRCYLVFHRNRIISSGTQDPICGDCS